jgi:hypothetical protein
MLLLPVSRSSKHKKATSLKNREQIVCPAPHSQLDKLKKKIKRQTLPQSLQKKSNHPTRKWSQIALQIASFNKVSTCQQPATESTKECLQLLKQRIHQRNMQH